MFRFLLQNDVVQNKDIFFKLWDIVTNPAKKRVLIREVFFNQKKNDRFNLSADIKIIEDGRLIWFN